MYLGVFFALLFTCVAISDVFADWPPTYCQRSIEYRSPPDLDLPYRRSSDNRNFNTNVNLNKNRIVQDYPIYDIPDDDTEEYVYRRQNNPSPYVRSLIKTHRRDPTDSDGSYRRSISDRNSNTNVNVNKNFQGLYDYAYL